MAANVVAASQPLAAQAGLTMLEKGGSAADAAIAAAATLMVVEPVSSGLGADAFALISHRGEIVGLNASGRAWSAAELGAIKHETLVVAGTADDLAGAPEPLARAFPNAKAVRVPGCGHMDCLIQPMFKGAVMDFLAGVPG